MPIAVFLETVTVLKLLHQENALSPIEVTLEGMVMPVRLVQPENAHSPIKVTLAGMVMLCEVSFSLSKFSILLFQKLLILNTNTSTNVFQYVFFPFSSEDS